MTIHQLPEPCFVLDPSPWRYSTPHYGTPAEALAALAQERDETEGDDGEGLAILAASRPKQLDAPCWVAECDAPEGLEGTCGDTLGDEDEGPACIHFATLKELLRWMPGEKWARSGPDGALCYVHGPYRDGDEPESEQDAAGQEEAGQLVIPGVTP